MTLDAPLAVRDERFEAIVIGFSHPVVVALHQRFRDRFGMGPRPVAYGCDARWLGITYRGEVVAVFSERDLANRTLEVVDAYCVPTKIGWSALWCGVFAYQDRLERGDITALVHPVLYANTRFWKAVVNITKQPPAALYFEHRRKGP